MACIQCLVATSILMWLKFRQLKPNTEFHKDKSRECGWGCGLMWGHSTPCYGNLKVRELGVSWYGWEGVVLLTLGPASLPASPSPTHPSPSTALPSHPTHTPSLQLVWGLGVACFRFDWCGWGREVSAFYCIWRSFKLRRFSIAILISIIAYSTGVLKSWNYLFKFSKHTKMYLRFSFEQFRSVGAFIWSFCFRITKFPFISKIRIGFENQLMETTNFSLTVSK
jgi:hypothetical protein